MGGLKNKIKIHLRDAAFKSYTINFENDDIVLVPKTRFVKTKSVKIKKKTYKMKNNQINIPYTKENYDYIMGHKLNFKFDAKVRDFNCHIPRKVRKIGYEYIKLNNQIYPYSKEGIVSLYDINIDNDKLSFRYQNRSLEVLDGLTFYLVDNHYQVIQSVKAKDEVITFTDVEYHTNQKECQILALTNKKAIIPTIDRSSRLVGHTLLSTRDNKLYIADKLYYSYTFEANNNLNKVKSINVKSKRFDVELDIEKRIVVFTLKSECQLDVYLQDILSGKERKLVSTNDYVSVDLDILLEEDLGYFNRRLLTYKVYEEEKVVEEGPVRLQMPKKKTLNTHILIETDKNRLVLFDDVYMMIENKECFLTYPEKYAIDFKKGAFLTDFSDPQWEDNCLSINLSIRSLLMPIEAVTFFVTDYYKKHTYFLSEEELSSQTRHFNERVTFDLKKFRPYFYNNMRLAFKVGVTYVDGYSEEGFISIAPKEFTVKERYLLESPEDDMVSVFYLGENQYNLNLWYSSYEEYQKGVKYQIGRETYYKTVNEESLDDHMILFEANLGKNYTGNPKYIYEYMISHPEYSNFTYIWTYPDIHTDKIPGDPILVERGTSEYFYYLAKAKYRINNIRFPVPHKKNGMVYLNTWHGTPLKKLGFDIECEGPEKQAFGSLYKESLTWDYMTVDNDYGEEKLVGAFRFKGHVIKKGYPINDIYYDEERKNRVTSRLKEAYPIIGSKKVILYAPTWRDLQGDYTRGYDFALPFDLEKLYKELSDDYVILVKLHHLIADHLNIDERYKDFILNVSNEEDVMELLCVTDLLITDYSSVFYDYASARKPILFYMYDLEEYLNETRGTYVPVDTLPGPIIKTDDELVKSIKDAESDHYSYRKRLEEFCDDFAMYCHGESSKDVVEIVIDKEDLV